MRFSENISPFKEVFGRIRYFFLFIALTAGFYSLNVFTQNFPSVLYIYEKSGPIGGTKFFATLLSGFGRTILPSSFAFIVIISVLFGIFLTMVVYRIRTISSAFGGEGFLGTIGVFLGVVAPGCAACGLGLLPLIGISASAFAVLPLKGLEVSIIASIILLISIIKVAQDIKRGFVCEINGKISGKKPKVRVKRAKRRI